MKIHCAYTELVPVKDLKPHPKNRNVHPPDQVERLAKILAYQGVRAPIVVSNLSKCMAKGHGTLMAIIKNGWTHAPVVYQDFDDEAQEYAYVQSDNAIANWAQLDFSGINLDIGDLGPDFDIDLLGIKGFEIEVADKHLGDPDAVPEAPAEPKTKLGDIYELGAHRLLCGDSTSIDAVERLMNGEKADMVFTDPPYGYKYESNHQSKHEMLLNDDTILDFLPCAFASTQDNAAFYICGSHQTVHKWRESVDQHLTYKNLIVWKKNNWSMGDLTGDFAGQHELIIFAHKGRVELRGERTRNVWEFDRDPPEHHPTQKPIELVELAIEKVSDSGGLCLDLFGGSGSTLIACEKTGRRCFMMELDPRYCDVILSRWAKYTGKDPVRDDGKKWSELNASG